MLSVLFLLILGQSVFAAAPNSCLTTLESKICATDLAPHQWPDPSIKCQEADENTVLKLKSIAQDFSDPFQKVLCGLDKVFIINEPGGTAFGGFTHDPSGHTHSFLGINAAVLKNGLSLSSWATWKEQLSFGGSPEPTNPAFQNLPIINATVPGVYNDFLFFVLSHEMGHIFDFANHLRSKDCGADQSIDCEMDKAGFGHLSWDTTTRIRPDSDFPERTGLCFYGCGGKFLDLSSVSSIYDHLFQSGFASLYASTNSADDFAESIAYYNLSQIPGAQYKIVTPQGKNYFPLVEYQSGVLLEKYQFIENLFKRSDLIFGGG